jgi:dihydroorotase/N-acyl-D-amino-acid deacylase
MTLAAIAAELAIMTEAVRNAMEDGAFGVAADRLLEAMDEAIRIGIEAGVPVEIYHLKAAGRRNWHKGPLAVAKIDSARAAGVDVQANMYPYSAAGTGLTACFPPWASANGRLFDNLASPEARARMRREMEEGTATGRTSATWPAPRASSSSA